MASTGLALAALLMATGEAQAARKKWDGSHASNNNWNESTNWSPDGVPGSSDDVIIDGTSNDPIVVTASTTVNTISISDGYTGTITINSNVTLTADNVSINDGLIGYWRLDETANGAVYDSSGHGSDLTHQGGVSSFTESLPTTRFRNPRGMTLASASGQYASRTTWPGILQPTAWTISAWINHNATLDTNGAEIFDINDNAAIRIEDHSALRVFKWNTASSHQHCQTSTIDLTGTGWHHVVGTFSGSAFTIYIDGSQITSGLSGTCSGAAAQSYGTALAAPIRIGSKPGSSNYDFDGSIDEVRMYDRVLTSTEVGYLYAGQHLPRQSQVQTIAGTGTLSITGDLTIASRSVSFSAATTINVGGSFYNFGGTTSGSATITLNGSGTDDVGGLGGPIHGFTLGGTATRTLLDRLEVGGTLALSGGTFDISSRVLRLGTINQTGGSITSTGSTVIIGSSSNQNVTVTSTLNNLRFEDPSETNLLAYFKFDELTGTNTSDYSGGGNHGTLQNGPTWTSSQIPTPRYPNAGALHFDAVDDAVSFPVASTTNLTITAWVYMTGDGESGFGRIVALPSVSLIVRGTDSDRLGMDASFSTTNGAWKTVGPIPLNQWAHVAVTWNGTTTAPTLYINGTGETGTVHGTPAAGTYSAAGGTGYVGNRTGYDRTWDGYIDDVRIYNTILTSAQINLIKDGGYPNVGGAATYTLAAATTAVSGDLSIDSGHLASGSNAITVGGSWVNEGFSYTGTGTVTFNGTATGKTITSYSQPFGALTFNGSGGGWTLQDRLWSTGQLTITNGTFATGNYAVHAGGLSQGGGTFTPGTNVITLDSNSTQSLSTTTSMATVRIEPTFETGLIGYWKFDEQVLTTARDVSGQGKHGTFVNSPTWTTSGAWTSTGSSTTIDNAGAVTFASASNQRIDFTDSGSPTTVSVSAWVNHSAGAADDWPRFVVLRNFRFYTNKTTRLLGALSERATTDGNWQTTGTYGAGWHHVAVTYDSTNTANDPIFYVDGAAITSQDTGFALQTTPSGALATPNTGSIGDHSDGSGSFNGSLDDIRVYDRVLTPTEIARLAASGYAGTGGGATVNLGAATTANTLLVVHNGTLATGSNTLAATHATNDTVVKGGAGLTVGGAAASFSDNLVIDDGGTLTMNATSGEIRMASGKVLQMNGSMVTSTGTSTPKPTIKSQSGTYSFHVGTSLTATPTLNINGLAVQNTDTNGMFVNQTSGSTTTFTRFDNISFSAGTGNYLLQIAHNTLTLFANGLSFDTTGTNATYNVKLTDRNAAGNDVRMFIGGTCVAPDDDCEAHDSDDDTAGILGGSFDGVPDDTGNDGSVIQWGYRGYSDVGGAIESFPAVAFNWNTYAFRGTYVLTNNSSGSDKLIKRDTDGALYHASATWTLPNGEDFVGTPRWIHDTGPDRYYVYVLSTAGRVYKLEDTGNSFTELASFRDGNSATGTSPLTLDTSNLYWAGASGTGTVSMFKLPLATLTGVASVSAAAVYAAPSLYTISGTKYLFSAASTKVYKVNTNFNPPSSIDLTNTTVRGRVTVVGGHVMFIDDAGKLWVIDGNSMAQVWTYQDTTSHACASGNSCEARNLFYDTLNGRVYYGDKDGHVYAVARNGTGGQLLWATPYDTGTEVIQAAPLYRSGVIAVGTTTGRVFFIDQRSTSATAPNAVAALIRAFHFGSVVINSIAYDHDGGQYVIGTGDGKLYYIHASLVADPTNSWN